MTKIEIISIVIHHLGKIHAKICIVYVGCLVCIQICSFISNYMCRRQCRLTSELFSGFSGLNAVMCVCMCERHVSQHTGFMSLCSLFRTLKQTVFDYLFIFFPLDRVLIPSHVPFYSLFQVFSASHSQLLSLFGSFFISFFLFSRAPSAPFSLWPTLAEQSSSAGLPLTLLFVWEKPCIKA